jgi:hypothetical protein
MLRGHKSRPHCHDTVLRYAVTLQVCTHLYRTCQTGKTFGLSRTYSKTTVKTHLVSAPRTGNNRIHLSNECSSVQQRQSNDPIISAVKRRQTSSKISLPHSQTVSKVSLHYVHTDKRTRFMNMKEFLFSSEINNNFKCVLLCSRSHSVASI